MHHVRKLPASNVTTVRTLATFFIKLTPLKNIHYPMPRLYVNTKHSSLYMNIALSKITSTNTWVFCETGQWSAHVVCRISAALSTCLLVHWSTDPNLWISGPQILWPVCFTFSVNHFIIVLMYLVILRCYLYFVSMAARESFITMSVLLMYCLISNLSVFYEQMKWWWWWWDTVCVFVEVDDVI